MPMTFVVISQCRPQCHLQTSSVRSSYTLITDGKCCRPSNCLTDTLRSKSPLVADIASIILEKGYCAVIALYKHSILQSARNVDGSDRPAISLIDPEETMAAQFAFF